MFGTGPCYAAAAAFWVLLAAAPASADWQHTQWGMSLGRLSSVKGVRLASQKEATERFDKLTGASVGAIAEYTSNGIDFFVYFFFRGDALAAVRLEPKNRADNTRLFELLKATYGKPESSGDEHAICRFRVQSYHDEAHLNLVRSELIECEGFLPLGGVTYSPLPSAGEPGSL